MTSKTLSCGHSTRLRRATFIPARADIAARRLYVGVSAAAVLVSAAAVGVIAPLVF